MTIMSDTKFDGTLERKLLIVLDQSLVGGVEAFRGSILFRDYDKAWDGVVMKLAQGVREYMKDKNHL